MPEKSKPQSALPPGASRNRLTDRKRAAILQAGVEEFQSRGYYAASMNGIAEAASVSKRTLYNHFAGKEALFDAMLEELIARAEQLPECEFDPDRELAEQLTELARTEVDFMTSDAIQALARAGLSRILVEPSVGREIDHGRFLKRVCTWMEKAQECGCLTDADPDFAASQFVGLLRTLAFWPSILHGEPAPSPRQRSQIVQSTVQMFLARYASE